MDYMTSTGEGTFYGPKIDLHMTDSLGRSWQMGTIQLDYQMPLQFGLTYSGSDNAEHHPVVIHRALLGSLERFIGIITEHYGGAFPLWLAPVQLRVIPVGEDHRAAAARLEAELVGVRVDVDQRDETVGKRIRDAEVEKVPYGRVARGPEARRRADHPLARRPSCRDFPGCYSVSLQVGAPKFLTSRA
jgi:threonyl-tRNA synthetase